MLKDSRSTGRIIPTLTQESHTSLLNNSWLHICTVNILFNFNGNIFVYYKLLYKANL